jgi:hypothetical protein
VAFANKVYGLPGDDSHAGPANARGDRSWLIVLDSDLTDALASGAISTRTHRIRGVVGPDRRCYVPASCLDDEQSNQGGSHAGKDNTDSLGGGVVAAMALTGLSSEPAQGAFAAGCQTTVATFVFQEGTAPIGVVQHRLTAKRCWNAAGRLTLTNLSSDVSTLWAGRAIGYTASAFTPFELGASSGTLGTKWLADGRAQGCLAWKTVLCGMFEVWRVDVIFTAAAFIGPIVSADQAAAFLVRPLNDTNDLKVKNVSVSTF